VVVIVTAATVFVGDVVVEASPHPLEKYFARAIPGTGTTTTTSTGVRRRRFLYGLTVLEFLNGVPDMRGTEPTLAADVLEDGLARGGLGQAPDAVGIVPPEARLSPAVPAAHPDKTQFAALIAANPVSH